MPACVPAESCEEGSWETDDLSAPFFIHSSSKHALCADYGPDTVIGLGM